VEEHTVRYNDLQNNRIICALSRQIILLIILPALQEIFYCATVGSDVKDVKLLYANNDSSKLLKTLACYSASLLECMSDRILMILSEFLHKKKFSLNFQCYCQYLIKMLKIT